MLCPVYGHELTPLSCPPSQGVSFRSFKGLIILSPYITPISFPRSIFTSTSKLLKAFPSHDIRGQPSHCQIYCPIRKPIVPAKRERNNFLLRNYAEITPINLRIIAEINLSA